MDKGYSLWLEAENKKNIKNIVSREQQLLAVHAEALDLFKRKNADYGDAFAKYGTTGVIMRMGDKIQRFVSVTKTGINLIESDTLRDTLMDLHNYSALMIMLLDEKCM